MAQAAVRADLGETLDIQRHLAAQIAFHGVLLLDEIAQHIHFGFGQIFDPRVGIDTSLSQNLLAGRQADAVNIRQTDFHPLVARQVNACYTCHILSLH